MTSSSRLRSDSVVCLLTHPHDPTTRTVSSIMVESAVNSYCDDCPTAYCTEETRSQSKDDLHALVRSQPTTTLSPLPRSPLHSPTPCLLLSTLP